MMQLTFVSNMISVIFLIAGASYFYKQKKFENEHIYSITNFIMAAITLLATAMLINMLQGFQTYFDINYFFQNLGIKLEYLVNINELVIFPLAGLSFLIAMILLKKHV